jgi:hypothetical protein
MMPRKDTTPVIDSLEDVVAAAGATAAAPATEPAPATSAAATPFEAVDRWFGRFIAAFEKIADAHDRQAEAMTDIAERMREQNEFMMSHGKPGS